MAYAGLDVKAMYELSEKAARAVRKRIPGYPLEDMVQDGIEWMLSHRHKIEEWHNDPESPDAGYGKTFKSVFHHIIDCTQREKALKSGYMPEDNYYYSVAALKRLLPLYYEDLLAEAQGGLAQQLNLPDRDAYLDIQRALKTVRSDVRVSLYQWFNKDADIEDVYNDIARLHDITNEAARKRVYRVIQKLQAELGGPRPVTSEFEGRKSKSNAAARFETDRTYGSAGEF